MAKDLNRGRPPPPILAWMCIDEQAWLFCFMIITTPALVAQLVMSARVPGNSEFASGVLRTTQAIASSVRQHTDFASRARTRWVPFGPVIHIMAPVGPHESHRAQPLNVFGWKIKLSRRWTNLTKCCNVVQIQRLGVQESVSKKRKCRP